MKNLKSIIVVFVLLFSPSLYAEIVEEPETPLSYPVLDVPYNLQYQNFSWPSMSQSLDASLNYYYLGHHWLSQWADGNGHNDVWYHLPFDIISTWMPLGNAWLHEEYHRAVMGNRNISSYNDVYNLNIGASTIAVSHVKDEDLVRLKGEFPADQVRLSAAGMEAENDMNLRLEKNTFFYDTQNKLVLLWLNAAGNISYMNACLDSDEDVDEHNAEDGTNVKVRDFTGFDCIAWAYDLHRPEEPYSARGTHPSGIGIDRYRKFSDLTDREQEFLTRQAYLSFINLANPFLYGQTHFSGKRNGKNFEWNFNFRHYMTAFGSSVDLNLFYKTQSLKSQIILHHYFNRSRFMPGLEVEYLDLPFYSDDYSLNLRAMLWLQPKNLIFSENEMKPGGLLGARVVKQISDKWRNFYDLEMKTQGWVAGNVYLDKNLSFRAGLIYLL